MDTPYKEQIMDDHKQFQREINKAALKGGLIGLKYAWRHRRALFCQAMRREHLLRARIWEGIAERESLQDILEGLMDLTAELDLEPGHLAHREAIEREINQAFRGRHRWSSDLPS